MGGLKYIRINSLELKSFDIARSLVNATILVLSPVKHHRVTPF